MTQTEIPQAETALEYARQRATEHGLWLPETDNMPASRPDGQGSSWLSRQYELSLEALGSLGINQQDDAVPSFEQVEAVFRPTDATWLDSRVMAGYHDRLVITPSVQAIGLKDLIRRYDLGQSRFNKTSVSKFWKNIDD